jgi:hypothetical protein
VPHAVAALHIARSEQNADRVFDQLVLLGHALEGAGRLDEAEQAMSRAIEMRPADAGLSEELRRLRARRGLLRLDSPTTAQ